MVYENIQRLSKNEHIKRYQSDSDELYNLRVSFIRTLVERFGIFVLKSYTEKEIQKLTFDLISELSRENEKFK